MCVLTEGRTREGGGVRRETEKIIRFGTFNIRNGQNAGLELALFGMAQGQVDCGVFQVMKLTKGVYTQKSSGFWVMATEAPSAHRGGVAIFYREAERFAIEDICLHEPNVIRFQLVTGRRRWDVVGCYIAPINDSTIEDVSETIRD